MKKLKSAEEYIKWYSEEMNKIYRPNIDHSHKILSVIIKQAQKDAIEAAV